MISNEDGKLELHEFKSDKCILSDDPKKNIWSANLNHDATKIVVSFKNGDLLLYQKENNTKFTKLWEIKAH